MGRHWSGTMGLKVRSLNEWLGGRSMLEQIIRGRQAARERRDVGFYVLSDQMLNRAKPNLPLRITLTRIAPDTLDGDNLWGGLKHVRDGVADALKIDDRESPMLSWDCAQEKGKPREYGLRILIEELP